MLEFIREKNSCWETIKNSNKPVVLYGMGNGADKILDWCEDNNVHISAVFASDEFVRGQSFRGFTVCKYRDVLEKYGKDILIVIAFASEIPEVLTAFKFLADEHEVIAPHLPLFNEEEMVNSSWLEKYAEKLEDVYSKLADDQSRKVFADILNYKLSGKIQYLFDCETARRKDLQTIFAFDNREIYLDLGAYNGDTVQEFLDLVSGSYQQIIAVEPDVKNYRKLSAMAESLDNIKVLQKGIWSEPQELGFSQNGGRQSTFMGNKKTVVEVDSIDNICAEQAVTYIKMDVEGAEKQALSGGSKTIAEYKPKMMIAAYHYDNDIFDLPQLIWQLNSDYKIYLRKHPYVPAWEINFLIKPKGHKVSN